MTTAVAPGGSRSEAYWTFVDARVLIGRTLRHIGRSPEQLMLMLFLPATLLIMFRYLFGGAINTGDLTYVNYVIAGIIAVSVTFNATIASTGVAGDLSEGIVERFRSMPVPSSVVLIGHVAASLVRNLVSIAVMVGVGYAVGFRPEAGLLAWLAALGLLALFVLAVSWLAVIIGLVAKTVEGASGMSMPLVFIPYLGSAFVPTATMPTGLQQFAEHQPVSVVVDAVRGLFLGMPIGNTGWLAVVWWGGVLVVAIPLAGWLFRRRARS